MKLVDITSQFVVLAVMLELMVMVLVVKDEVKAVMSTAPLALSMMLPGLFAEFE